ncbi:LrgB family protein [Paenibacillus daejeonensis]|uniref:LrgB family protein n=1 Tax=Paenibacillus daejeonensis TaxID=135193 RepID=UPI000368A27E|nr:LrgB family protein [Paenibacillus daejeonensis]
MDEWWMAPVFGVALTVGIYMLSITANRRLRWLHPLFTCSVLIIAILLLLDIPYDDYMAGGEWITFLLGPATVALAVPLHKHWELIRNQLLPITTGITVGVAVGFASNAFLIRAFGGSDELLFTVLPKSATAPISIEIVARLGGIPELGAVLTVLTGLFGSMVGTWCLRKIGVHTDLAIGIAMGTAAHGIGTAKVLRDSERQGAYSSLAMGLTGILISVAAMFWG